MKEHNIVQTLLTLDISKSICFQQNFVTLQTVEGALLLKYFCCTKALWRLQFEKWLLYNCAGIYNLSSETMHDRLNILSNLTKISGFTTCVFSLNNYWLVAIGLSKSLIDFVSGTDYVIFSCFFPNRENYPFGNQPNQMCPAIKLL